MIHLTYLQFFGALALAIMVGASATLLLAATLGRMGDPEGGDDQEYL